MTQKNIKPVFLLTGCTYSTHDKQPHELNSTAISSIASKAMNSFQAYTDTWSKKTRPQRLKYKIDCVANEACSEKPMEVTCLNIFFQMSKLDQCF